jgi:hypothetical protein
MKKINQNNWPFHSVSVSPEGNRFATDSPKWEIDSDQEVWCDVFYKARSSMPYFLCDDVKKMVQDCGAHDRTERLSFVEILSPLDSANVEITGRAKAGKGREFVNAVNPREKELRIKIEDLDR